MLDTSDFDLEQDDDLSTPPPSYAFALEQSLHQGVELGQDGRVVINPDSRLVKSFARFAPGSKTTIPQESGERSSLSDVSTSNQLLNLTGPPDAPCKLTLNIVIQVVGSRGDIQPFIALGNELQRYGHRVRLATHDIFESFVTTSNLEFYPIGGDPTELMAYMVKNPGLLPSMKSILSGDVQKKRLMVSQILKGCWRSCVEPDRKSGKPFVAEAIIANPPSFAHVHCAEALGIPLHLMFTMPWSSTRFFSHPLANIHVSDKMSEKSLQVLNWITFAIVEFMTWQGLGDLINDWRLTIDLAPIPFTEGPLLTDKLKIPATYCWSPALIPKPKDWADHIDVCGFFFREQPQYTPPPDLKEFLRRGPAPIYVGFGSIVVDDSEKLTQMILTAATEIGARLIISRGWSRLGGSRESTDQVLFIDDCPHEWLFTQVVAVAHHGGAGTTACGIRVAKPTLVIPFFGDQFFWGNMIAEVGAGPKPIPYSELTQESLTAGLAFCVSREALVAAQSISLQMRDEVGVASAVRSFHRHLPLQNMRCQILTNRPAVWTYSRKGKKLLLSNLAAEILVDHLKIDRRKLKPHKPNKIDIENRRWDPITGVSSAVVGTYSGVVSAATNIINNPINAYQKAMATQGVVPKSIEPFSHHPSDSPLDIHQRHSEEGKNLQKHTRSCLTIGGTMALGVAAGVGSVVGNASKGYFIDIPLALTEGIRNLPRLYGGQVRDYGRVKDWKSGLIVSGKSLGYGIGQGLFDVSYGPVQGMRAEGALGGIKGLGKGLLGLGINLSVGILGIVAYPSYGAYKSFRGALHTQTRDRIIAARQAKAKYELKMEAGTTKHVLKEFQLLFPSIPSH
ncbi:glycosyltransferase family 1 protein [Annulohypoxylon nitens]|nr:glycosyltransferase family 1 protein [Annulohypoxylon nitens]